MGICLDTEAKSKNANGQQPVGVRQPSVQQQPQQNVITSNSNGGVASPRPRGIRPSGVPVAPVVFVLGGPGSGKITHSESLVRQHPGFVHLNMTRILQQLANRSGLGDLGILPTNQVTGTLMATMRSSSSPNMRGFVVSGYPRNMRDVSDYFEKIGRCDGVILINWHDATLERQIEFGARQGAIDLDLAKLELKNFRLNVFPVAEYFDYKQLLYVVSGERKPESIYNDFRKAFEQILSSEVRLTRPRPQSSGSYRDYRNNLEEVEEEDEDEGVQMKEISSSSVITRRPSHRWARGKKPFVIWIVGGPGSAKADRLELLLSLHQGWKLISVGRTLWQHLTDRYPNGLDENSRFTQDNKEDIDSDAVVVDAEEVMRKGERVPQGIILDLVLEEMYREDAEGFFITGFPSDVLQAQGFEERMGLRPPCILIDCSELELSRSLAKRRGGKIGDNVEAYRKRLVLYRQFTLPMLKTFDQQNRLKIVDGDSDDGQVNKELRRCIHREVAALKRERAVGTIHENDGTTEMDDKAEVLTLDQGGYQPVDEVPKDEKPKKTVRYYDGIDPEVEADLKNVIEELQHRNGNSTQQY